MEVSISSNILATAEETVECPECHGTGRVKRVVFLINGVPADEIGTSDIQHRYEEVP